MLFFRPLGVLCALAALVLVSVPETVRAADAPSEVTIAYQYGIGYANMVVLKQQKTLEKQFPNTKFEWKTIAYGAAVRDAIIANQVQIGSGGIGAFLLGWDRGVGYRLIAPMNSMDLWLVTKDPKIKSLKDITPDMKIGLPGPDSPQASILRKGALDELGNAHALDNNFVTMGHPDGMQALSVNQIAAHMTSPPFEYQEVASGGKVLLRGYQLMGPSTFNSAYTTQKFYDQYPKFVEAFYKDMVEVTLFIRLHPHEAAEYLSKESDGKQSADVFEKYLRHPDVSFDNSPHGFLKYAKFMQQTGLMKNVPASMKEIELPFLGGKGN